MAKFFSDDGRVLDEDDVLKAVKFYEFLFNAKHTEIATRNRSNRGGQSPKPAAKLRKALGTFTSPLNRPVRVSTPKGNVIVRGE